MKINNFGPMGVNPYKKNLDKQAKVENSSNKAEDKVEISKTAKELQQVSPIVAARQEKVEAIKQQVQNGNYTVDPKATAKGIINFYKI